MEELSSNLCVCVWRSYHPTYFSLSARSGAEKPSDPPFKTPFFSSTSFLPNPSKILKSRPPPPSSSGRLHVSAVPLSMAVKECKVKYMISASVLLITREGGLELYQDMVLGRPFDTMCVRIYYDEDIAGFETVVFVLDNNLWAIGLSLLRATFDPEIWKKRPPFGMPEAHVDGMGVVKVEVAKEAVAGVLCRTYWFRGHSLADPDKLRPDGSHCLVGL